MLSEENQFLFEEMKPGYFDNNVDTALTYSLLENVLNQVENKTDQPKQGALTFEKTSNRFRRWKKEGEVWIKQPLSEQEDQAIFELYNQHKDNEAKRNLWATIDFGQYLKAKEQGLKEWEENWEREDNRGGPRYKS
jgi:hypothetical protein